MFCKLVFNLQIGIVLLQNTFVVLSDWTDCARNRSILLVTVNT